MPSSHREPTLLFELLEKLRESQLSDAEDAQLCEMLRASEAARSIYNRYLNLIAGLHWERTLDDQANELLNSCQDAESEANPVSSPFPGQAEAHPLSKTPARLQPIMGAVGHGVRYLSSPGRFGVVTATVTCLSLLLFFAQIPWTPSAAPRTQTLAPTALAAPQAAALVQAYQCRWAGAAPEDALVAGDELQLLEGAAEIHFGDGAQVRLLGPTRIQIESACMGRLLAGQISVMAPPRARGFTIRTVGMDIVDLGTEFSVVAEEFASSAVYVRRGKIRVQPQHGAKSKPGQDLAAGEAVQVDAQGDYQPVRTPMATRLRADFALQADARGTSAASASRTQISGKPVARMRNAPRIAYQVPSETLGNQGYSGGLGMDFDVLAPIEIRALGAFDHQGDGFAPGTVITVELWRRQNNDTPFDPRDDRAGEMLVKQQFTAAHPGNLIGGSRFLPLEAPLRLDPGAYTIVARGYNADDLLANSRGAPVEWTVNDGRGRLQFLGLSRYGDGFPMQLDWKPYQYAAGTFEYQPILPRTAESGGSR